MRFTTPHAPGPLIICHTAHLCPSVNIPPTPPATHPKDRNCGRGHPPTIVTPIGLFPAGGSYRPKIILDRCKYMSYNRCMNKQTREKILGTPQPIRPNQEPERWRDRLERCIQCRAIHLRNTPDPVMCSCHHPRFPTNKIRYPGSALFPEATRFCTTCCYIILGTYSAAKHEERCQNHDLKPLPPLEEICPTEEV